MYSLLANNRTDNWYSCLASWLSRAVSQWKWIHCLETNYFLGLGLGSLTLHYLLIFHLHHFHPILASFFSYTSLFKNLLLSQCCCDDNQVTILVNFNFYLFTVFAYNFTFLPLFCFLWIFISTICQKVNSLFFL